MRLLPGAVNELLLYGTMVAEGKLLGHATVFLLYKDKLVYLDNNLKTPLCDDPSLLPMTAGKFDWDKLEGYEYKQVQLYMLQAEEVKGTDEEDRRRRLAKKEAFAKMIIETDEPTEAERAERVSASIASARESYQEKKREKKAFSKRSSLNQSELRLSVDDL
jgi:hypothetical protein